MVTTNDLNAMVEWLLANYAYGHLDEVPDWFLMTVLCDPRASVSFACLCHQASQTVTDSVEELVAAYGKTTVKDVVSAHGRVRLWMMCERLRRMGKLRFKTDILIKEIATLDHHGIVSQEGRNFVSIVEVLPGVAYIVGEEIQLF